MDVANPLRVALADTWAFYFRAHAFHWNVTGPLFPQLHSFFGDLYSDTFSAVDGLAEELRAMKELAPTSLADIAAPASIPTTGTEIPSGEDMVALLKADNEVVISSLSVAQSAAEANDMVGLANYLQDRIDKHRKWGWMLTAQLEPRPTRRDVLYDNPRIMARVKSVTH